MKASRVFALFAVLALVGGLALAAEDQSSAMPGDRGMMSGQMNLQKSHDIIGQDIKSSTGEKLGTVDDLVLSPDHKRVDFVIARSGGLAGVGAKYYAIPWSACKATSGQKGLTLNINKDKFNSAPSFEKKNWPDLNSSQEKDRLNSFYGTSGMGNMPSGTAAPSGSETPSGSGFSGSPAPSPSATPSGTAAPSGSSGTGNTGSATPSDSGTPSGSGYSGDMSDQSARGSAEMDSEHGRLARVTEITGTNCKNSKGESLGEIENLMIDTSNGQIAYAVVGYGGVIGVGEKYVAVPWNSVQYAPSQSVAMINIDKPTFESLAFTGDKWPDLASNEYQQRIQGKFSNAPTGQVYGYVAPTGEQRTKAWANDSSYNKQFKADSMTKIDGTIESVGTFRPEPGAEPGLRLRVTTSDNQTMIVQAGPVAFAEDKGFTFHQGDKITVNGSKVQMGGRTVLMASTVDLSGKTLTLRDEKGNVQWTSDQLLKGREMQKGKAGESWNKPSDKSTGAPDKGTPSGDSSGTPSGGSTGTPAGGSGSGS